MSYILRNIPEPLWADAKAKAKAEGIPLRALILALLSAYVEGRIIIQNVSVKS